MFSQATLRTIGEEQLGSSQLYLFDTWKRALMGGAVGLQEGNPTQRWAYRNGYFVELIEREAPYYRGRRDNDSSMNDRFNSTLPTSRKRCIYVEPSPIEIGGE